MKKAKSSSTEHLWNTTNPIKLAATKLGIELDPWQIKYINTEGNTAVRAGRQSGKSFAQSLRVALFALLNDNTQTLIIGAVDRQSVELFEKVKSHILILAKHAIAKKPTMKRLELKNGSKIIALPAGRTGYGLRGYAIDKLVIDEAHYVPEEVFVALRPMLATTGGTMDLLSTPRGNKGFFYDCFNDEQISQDFTTYHTTSEECPRISKEFLKGEKRRLTKLQYAQEYLAEFLDELQQFFPAKLIDPLMTLEEKQPTDGEYYDGMDLAAWGKDETAYTMVRMFSKTKVEMVNLEVTEQVNIRSTLSTMRTRERVWKPRKVYIDSGQGGGGGAIFDLLIEDSQFKRKIVGINNSSKPLTFDKKHTKKILKEDLYNNLRRMLEQGEIKLLNNPQLRTSLLSIQFEHSDDGRFKIFGKYSHITEALIRACWAVKTKGLKLYVY